MRSKQKQDESKRNGIILDMILAVTLERYRERWQIERAYKYFIYYIILKPFKTLNSEID